jgi:hypothetical protein
MKTLKLSDLENYLGIDVSNEISLYEYGLLCKTNDLNDIHCYYGIGSDNSGNFNTFDCSELSKHEIIGLFNELDKPGLLSYTGLTEDQFLAEDPIHQIYNLLNYFGYENIFGHCYMSFEIENN